MMVVHRLLTLLVVITCCYCLQCILGEVTTDPVVNIGHTNIRGKVTQTDGGNRPVFAFRSIYYANPPVGSNRFSAPSPRTLPAGDYDATDYGPLCPQDMELLALAYHGYPIPSKKPSEDCLHLDVYTPTLDTNSRLPVMVWIHGGAFVNGGNALYDGSALAESQNVIVVAINYRVGPLGFLSFGDESAPGNYGLLDQQLAFRWVQNNIVYFGGDNGRVTIFGESAGGMCTSIHPLVPSNQQLFHRVITQSGPANSAMVVVENPSKWGGIMAEAVGCAGNNTERIINCLRTKSAEDISLVKIPESPDKPFLPFGPVVDGRFLLDYPMKLYQAGLIRVKADILIGFNNNEGGYGLLATRGPSGIDLSKFGVDMFRLMMVQEFSKLVPGDLSNLISRIEDIYSGPEGITDQTAFQTLGHIIGDGFVIAPSLAIADYTSESGFYTFVYEFQHRPSYYHGPEFVGADHGAEEPLVHGFPFLTKERQGSFTFTEEEKSLSDVMMTYWANFAKYSDPNGEKFELPYWPPYSYTEKTYMQLRPIPEIAGNLKPNKVAFWNTVFSSVHVLKEGTFKHLSDEL
ncbi:putative carboxylesterase 5A [Apostichopus japonicus]|uniref:Carboxylic ester hydrolase n=1 Tax=Stichopus japonicus TaxID=307972 RepID=A0A2G8K1P8_STIJA|nr:putative carboxylesterase 5A [Apostichopus japonicus]